MILHRFTRICIARSLLILLVLFQLVACGSGGGESSGGTAKLSWIAPSEREDGSSLSLSEIAGYRVYYGHSVGQYINSFGITDSSAVQADLGSLPAGNYVFVVTTLDTDGRESVYSEAVLITI